MAEAPVKRNVPEGANPRELNDHQQYGHYLSTMTSGGNGDPQYSTYQQMRAFQMVQDDQRAVEEAARKAKEEQEKTNGGVKTATGGPLQASATSSANPNAAKSAVGAPYSSGSYTYDYNNPTEKTFDTVAYLAANPGMEAELSKHGVSAWTHYQKHGKKEKGKSKYE